MDVETLLKRITYTERGLLLLAALFVGLNSLALGVVRTGGVVTEAQAHFWGPLLWLVLVVAVHLGLNRWRPWRDPLLLPLLALLLGWGGLLIDRLAANFLGRQMAWVMLCLVVLLATAVLPFPWRWIQQYRYSLLLSGLLLLATTLLWGVNPSGFGARLWLPLPVGFTTLYFQPSELLKLLLVIYLASYFSHREELLRWESIPHGRFGPLPYLAPLLLMWGFCLLLLIWQRDLGAATLFFILFMVLLYIASGEWRYLASGAILLGGAALLGYFAFDVVALRVETWWNPWPESDNRAFQIVQSLYAVGSGGIFGRGIGQGFPGYIPVVHSDFAFAAIVEEWGVIGGGLVILLFAVLTQRGLRIALMAKLPFDRYLATGITIVLTTQAMLILGGVTKLIPLTGVTLPFVSYGGSSLLVCTIMVGLLLHLSADSYRPRFMRDE